MKIAKILPIMILVMACAFLSLACSNAKSPVSPSNDMPESLNADVHSRSLLEAYDAFIDPIAKTFTISPIERNAQYHFPLTSFYPNILQITDFGWSPNFWADIRLAHPLPGSGIDGFDPRVIAIIPANPGVSFNYSTLDVVANNAVVLEQDGYTKLFDYLGDDTLGNANPFKAYFKDQPFRICSSTDVTKETQRWQMDIAGFGGPFNFKLIVDVSTNAPHPPTPIVDNAPEPINIDAEVGSGLTSSGGNAGISVTLLDWQGQTGIGGVQVEAPDLFNDTVALSYSVPGPNPDEYIYTGTIENEKLAPEGEYKYLVAAWDQAKNIYIYDEFTVNVSYVADEGNLIWAKHAGGTFYDRGYAITTLSDNSTVVTGHFQDSATFGPGEPNETVLNCPGGYDIFVAKYNSDGTLAWAKRAGGTSNNNAIGITTLSDNSTVVTGYYQDWATFGPGEPNETIMVSAGGGDIFIARYNPDGTLAWAKRAWGIDNACGYEITTVSGNSIVVTGYFVGSSTFGQDEPNETTLTSADGSDIFIARYNPDGTLAWAKRAGGPSSDHTDGITTLSDNSTAVTGYFVGSATFGPGEPNETVLNSAGSNDFFVARYNPDGTLAWAKRAGGASNTQGFGITTLSDNSLVVTGLISGVTTFGPGEPNETILNTAGIYDFLIAKFNSDGTLAWAKASGGTSYDYGLGIKSLSDNSTVVTGLFTGLATFGLGEPNETLLTSAGTQDILIARYNPDGTLAWAKRAGGLDDDYGQAISTFSDNSIIVSGYFEESASFGLDEPNETILTSTGSSDIFIARFQP